MITEHNLLYAKGESSYWLKLNKYSDLTHEELLAQMTGGFSMKIEFPNGLPEPESTEGIANAIDWRDSGDVSSVKDQAQCGSCWAFSAVAALESAMSIAGRGLPNLSEQQLVDCSGPYGNQGCNGGWPDDAYHYVRDAGGMNPESSYPYTARDGTCKFDSGNIKATVSSYTNLASGSESALTNALNKQPVSVCIDAGHHFGSYGGGVYDESACTSYVNHAVTAVGYGTASGKDYYIVKNSWGSSWGEAGYIRMSRNKSNQCGIASYAVYPTV